MSHVLIANVSTHSQRRILLGDGTIEIASSQNNAVETCCYLIILVLYKHTLIGIEMGISELIGQTQLTTFTQCVGSSSARDEVIATQ